MRHEILCYIALLAAACGKEPTPGASHSTRPATAKTAEALVGTTTPPVPPQSNGVSYQEIRGGPVDARPLSLCELLKFFTAGAGAYRVKSLTGYTEELLDHPGNFDGFTYVELELVADWSGASPSNPVLRIAGGPKTPDITRRWTVSLTVGEVVGLLVVPASPANRGFPGIDSLGLFREEPGGGYSNGQLFTKQPAALDTIGHTIQNLVPLGAECAQSDVLPDLDGPPSDAPGPLGPEPIATAGPTLPADGSAP